MPTPFVVWSYAKSAAKWPGSGEVAVFGKRVRLTSFRRRIGKAANRITAPTRPGLMLEMRAIRPLTA